jgi:2'-5' RNA ligase
VATLYTVAFPALSAADRAQIDAIRGRHDARNARVIPPHFTLVFACSAVDERDYLDHVRAIAERTPRIPFTCRYAKLGPASEGAAAHVYLVPDEGSSRIALLHDRLYGGPLAPHLRRDLPYVPHITIGSFDARAEAEALCKQLNTQGMMIEGTLDALSAGSLHEDRFRTHAACPLQPGAIVE